MNFFLGNLALDVTEEELRALFVPLGSVLRVSIMRDTQSGEPRGFGFVELETDIGVDAVLRALSGHRIRERPLFIEEAHPKTDRRHDDRLAQGSKCPDHERRGGPS